MPDLDRAQKTAQVLTLLDDSFRAHQRGDKEACGHAVEAALALDAECVVVIRGGMLIGEIPNPDRDPQGWADYVATALDFAAMPVRYIPAHDEPEPDL